MMHDDTPDYADPAYVDAGGSEVEIEETALQADGDDENWAEEYVDSFLEKTECGSILSRRIWRRCLSRLGRVHELHPGSDRHSDGSVSREKAQGQRKR